MPLIWIGFWQHIFFSVGLVTRTTEPDCIQDRPQKRRIPWLAAIEVQLCVLRSSGEESVWLGRTLQQDQGPSHPIRFTWPLLLARMRTHMRTYNDNWENVCLHWEAFILSKGIPLCQRQQPQALLCQANLSLYSWAFTCDELQQALITCFHIACSLCPMASHGGNDLRCLRLFVEGTKRLLQKKKVPVRRWQACRCNGSNSQPSVCCLRLHFLSSDRVRLTAAWSGRGTDILVPVFASQDAQSRLSCGKGDVITSICFCEDSSSLRGGCWGGGGRFPPSAWENHSSVFTWHAVWLRPPPATE